MSFSLADALKEKEVPFDLPDSKILFSSKKESPGGIVLSYDDEIIPALEAYAGQEADDSPALAELERDMLAGLITDDRFFHIFDSSGEIPALYGKSVLAEKFGKYYRLNIFSSEDRYSFSEHFSAELSKPAAVQSSDIYLQFGSTGKYWFSINLEKILSGFPASGEDVYNYAKFLESRCSINPLNEPVLPFNHGGSNFIFYLALNPEFSSTLCDSSGKAVSGNYLTSRNYSVLGAAWTEYDKNGEKINPLPIIPELSIKVSIYAWDCIRPALSETDKADLASARDALYEILKINNN